MSAIEIVEVNGMPLAPKGDLADSLNFKRITFCLPYDKAAGYIEAYKRMIDLMQNSLTIDEKINLKKRIDSDKYSKPTVEIYCNNAKVIYLDTILNYVNLNTERPNDGLIDNSIGISNPKSKITSIRIDIEIHLGNPSLIQYGKGVKNSNIIIESVYDSCCGIPTNPNYKFKYMEE